MSKVRLTANKFFIKIKVKKLKVVYATGFGTNVPSSGFFQVTQLYKLHWCAVNQFTAHHTNQTISQHQ
jgi:hypothetical protein